MIKFTFFMCSAVVENLKWCWMKFHYGNKLFEIRYIIISRETNIVYIGGLRRRSIEKLVFL